MFSSQNAAWTMIVALIRHHDPQVAVDTVSCRLAVMAVVRFRSWIERDIEVRPRTESSIPKYHVCSSKRIAKNPSMGLHEA